MFKTYFTIIQLLTINICLLKRIIYIQKILAREVRHLEYIILIVFN